MSKAGRLIVISGFSGSGKGTVVKKLVEKYAYSLSISATTRAPREGEADGREYHFKTQAEFFNLIDYNGFIEYTQYVENYYGTPRAFVEQEMKAGRDIILEIEVEGARNVKRQYEDAILIFVTAPSAGELRERLMGRNTESFDKIQKRLARAREEAQSMKDYEFIVVNRTGKVEECADLIHDIVLAQKSRVEEQEDFIEQMNTELEAIEIKLPQSH